MAGYQAQLGLTEQEQACTATKLTSHPELASKAKAGLSPGTSDYAALLALVQACRRQLTFGPRFAQLTAQRAAQQGRQLTPEQLTCLSNAVGELPQTDIDTIFSGGVFPEGPQGQAARDKMTALMTGCGVPG